MNCVGRTFDQLDMFRLPEAAKMAALFAAVSSGKNPPPVEMEVAVKSGERLILDVRVTPLKRDNDVVWSCRCFERHHRAQAGAGSTPGV